VADLRKRRTWRPFSWKFFTFCARNVWNSKMCTIGGNDGSQISKIVRLLEAPPMHCRPPFSVTVYLLIPTRWRLGFRLPNPPSLSKYWIRHCFWWQLRVWYESAVYVVALPHGECQEGKNTRSPSSPFYLKVGPYTSKQLLLSRYMIWHESVALSAQIWQQEGMEGEVCFTGFKGYVIPCCTTESHQNPKSGVWESLCK